VITVTSAQLNAWLALFVWPFARIMALFSTDPILGNASVPVRVKVFAAFLVTIVIAPVLPALPDVAPGSPAGLLVLAQQILIGAAMGLAMRVVFSAVEMAGYLAGMQMGLGFATFFDPQNGAQTPALAQLLSLFAMLLFLAFDGHLAVIAALVKSFDMLPLSPQPLSAAGISVLMDWAKQIFTAGVAMSLPVVGALLVANLAIGIMSRAAPQLNIFAVGFPVTLVGGMVLLAMLVPFLTPMLERLATEGVSTLAKMLGGFAPRSP
jgi:flagellar biosynthetic protein FliR